MPRKKFKEPTGKERMKRRLPVGSRPARLEQDIKKAYTQDQLYEVGAITLLWNQIEAGVNFLLFIVLSSSSLHHSIWLGMMKKIQSLDGKIEILRKQYEASDILNQSKKLHKISFRCSK
jgi:hypothetical protein